MGKHDSPPDSPLSYMTSSADDFEDDAVMDDLPPAKRQKVKAGSTASSGAVAPEPEGEPEGDETEAIEGLSDVYVSDDTEGDIPSSPANARLEEDDYQEQVSFCLWEGCEAGDLGNMDKLVEHIHNDHIEGKQKKYTCEWVGCPRKSMPHASGYALKAHMRSHTREKPFYCYLPECDRAFTRSDALAKHMRTVHETEALRPSDPVPKSMQGGGPVKGSSKSLKIILKTPQSHSAGHDDVMDDGTGGDDMSEFFTALTEEQGFSREEIEMPLERLHGLCRFQVKWAERDGEQLKKECQDLEQIYKEEWLDKQVLLDQALQSELDWHARRKVVLSGALDVKVGPEVTVDGPADKSAAASGVVGEAEKGEEPESDG